MLIFKDSKTTTPFNLVFNEVASRFNKRGSYRDYNVLSTLNINAYFYLKNYSILCGNDTFNLSSLLYDFRAEFYL